MMYLLIAVMLLAPTEGFAMKAVLPVPSPGPAAVPTNPEPAAARGNENITGTAAEVAKQRWLHLCPCRKRRQQAVGCSAGHEGGRGGKGFVRARG